MLALCLANYSRHLVVMRRRHAFFLSISEAEPTPSLPEKRPPSGFVGIGFQSTATKNRSSRLRTEENNSEFSSGNESSGEFQTRGRRLRGRRKSRDESWLPSRHLNRDERESSLKKGQTFRSKAKDIDKSGAENTESLARVRDRGNEGQENKVSDVQTKQKSSKIRAKTETISENKEASRTPECRKTDLVSNASAELKESEKEIHSSESSLKRDGCDMNSKHPHKKGAVALEASAELSDQGEDSEPNSDIETFKNEKGTRAVSKGSSRTSEKDLRRRSLTLNLNSSRSLRSDGESPPCDVVTTSQDEDSESYSDAFDESPLVENKSFQVSL